MGVLLKFIWGLLLIGLGLPSCTHYYYSPGSHNVPLFERKGQATVSGIAGGNKQIEIQAAAAFTNHFAASYNYYQCKRIWDINDLFGGDYLYSGANKGHLHEGGIMYYRTWKKIFPFEVHTNYAGGSVFNKYEYGNSKMNIHKWSFQTTLGFRNKNKELAFSCRTGRINFTNIQIQGFYDINEEETKDLFYVKDNPTSWVLEPAFTGRAGYQFASLQLQIGWSFNLNNPHLKQIRSYLRAGLIFRLNRKKEGNSIY